MTFKRSPFPMHKGTASHRSALKQGISDIFGDETFGPVKEPVGPRADIVEGEDKELDLEKDPGQVTADLVEAKKPEDFQDTLPTKEDEAQKLTEATTDVEEPHKEKQISKDQWKQEKKAKRKERWKKRGEAFDKLGYVVDEAVNRQGKATQSFEVWKNRGKPGYQWDENDPNSKTAQPWDFQKTDDTEKEKNEKKADDKGNKSEKVAYKSKYSPEQIDKIIDAIMKGSEESTEEIVEKKKK